MTHSQSDRLSVWRLVAGAGLSMALGVWIFGATDVQDLTVAVVLGLLAAFAAGRWNRSFGIHLAVGPWRGAAALPGRVLADFGRLLVTLGGALAGRPRRPGGFRWVAVEGAGGQTHHAALLLATSIPPNTIAVDVESDRQVVVHQLRRAPAEPEPSHDP